MKRSSDVGSHYIPLAILQCKNVLYMVVVIKVCECYLLQLVKFYGFCEDEERS